MPGAVGACCIEIADAGAPICGNKALMAGEMFVCYRRAEVAWARKLHSLFCTGGEETGYYALVESGQDLARATVQVRFAETISHFAASNRFASA